MQPWRSEEHIEQLKRGLALLYRSSSNPTLVDTLKLHLVDTLKLHLADTSDPSEQAYRRFLDANPELGISEQGLEIIQEALNHNHGFDMLRAAIVRVARHISVGEAQVLHSMLKVYKLVAPSNVSLVAGGSVPPVNGQSQVLVDPWTVDIQKEWNSEAVLSDMLAASLSDYTRRTNRIAVLHENGYILGRVAHLTEVRDFAVHNRYAMGNSTLSTSLWPARHSKVEMNLFIEGTATVGLLIDPFSVAEEDFANSFNENAFTKGSGFISTKKRTDGCYTVQAQKELFDFMDTLCRNGGDAGGVAVSIDKNRQRWVPEVGHGRHTTSRRGATGESSTTVGHNEQCLYRPSIYDAFLGFFVKTNLVGFFGVLKDVARLQYDILTTRGLYVPIMLFDSKRNEMQDFVVDGLIHALLKSPANTVIRSDVKSELSNKLQAAGLSQTMITAAVNCPSDRLRQVVEIHVLLFMAKSAGDRFALFESGFKEVRALDNLHLIFPTIWPTNNSGSDVIDPGFVLGLQDLVTLDTDVNLRKFFSQTLQHACRMFLGLDLTTLTLDVSVVIDMYSRNEFMGEFARVFSRALQCLILFRVLPDIGAPVDCVRTHFPRLGMLPSCVDMLLGSIEMQGIALLMGRLDGVHHMRMGPQFELAFHYVTQNNHDMEDLNRKHRNYFQSFDDGTVGFVTTGGMRLTLNSMVTLPSGHKKQQIVTMASPPLPNPMLPVLLQNNLLNVLQPVAVSNPQMFTTVSNQFDVLIALMQNTDHFEKLSPSAQLQVEELIIDHAQTLSLLGSVPDMSVVSSLCPQFAQTAEGAHAMTDDTTPVGWYMCCMHTPMWMRTECPFVERRKSCTVTVTRRGGGSSHETTESVENIWRDAVTLSQQRTALANILRLSSESASIYHTLGLLTQLPAVTTGGIHTYASVSAIAKFDIDVEFYDGESKRHPKAPFLNVRDVLGNYAINLLTGSAMDPARVHEDQDTFELSVNVCILQHVPADGWRQSCKRLLTQTLAVTVSGDDTVIRANGMYYSPHPRPGPGINNEYHNGNEKFRFRSSRPRIYGAWPEGGAWPGMGAYNREALRTVEAYDQTLLSDIERRYKRAYLVGSAFVTTSAKGGFNSTRVPTNSRRVLFLDTRGPQFEKADSVTFTYVDGTTVPNALECADFVNSSNVRPSSCIFKELVDASYMVPVGSRKEQSVYFDKGAYTQAILTYIAHIVTVVRKRMTGTAASHLGVAGKRVHLKATLFGGGFFAKLGGTNSPIDLRQFVVEAMLKAYMACLPMMQGCIAVLEFVRYDIDDSTRSIMDALVTSASAMTPRVVVLESAEGDLLDLSVVADDHFPVILNAGDAMSWCGNEADSVSVEAMLGNATNIRVAMNAWANPRILEDDRYDLIAVPLPLTPHVLHTMEMVLKNLRCMDLTGTTGMCDIPVQFGSLSRVYRFVVFASAVHPANPAWASMTVHGFQMRENAVRVLVKSSGSSTLYAADIDAPDKRVPIDSQVKERLQSLRMSFS